MKVQVLLAMVGVLAFSGPASANLLEVKKSVEEAMCKKLATDYANNLNTFSVQSIAQLQICLAQSLQNTTSTAIPRHFDIEPPRPSTNTVDTMLPTPPTPPTPPQSIKIK